VTLVTQYAALSDVGLHRQTNEDSCVAAPPLFVVADGMGGAEAGEVASSLAVETLAARVAAGDTLADAAQAANEAVFARAGRRAEERGMGTTLTAAIVDGEQARFVHVGDSRAYRLRDGLLEPLSDDHSLVGELVRDGTLTREEAAAHPQRSILSRVLGTEATVEIDEFTADLRAGDVLLLCSDGLSGEIPEETLRELLAAAAPAEAVRDLISAARAAGGHDNITAVVIAVEAGDEDGTADSESATRIIAVPGAALDAGAEAAPDAVAGHVRDGDGDEAPEAATAHEAASTDEVVGAPAPAARSATSHRRLALLVAVLALVALLGIAGVVVVNTCYYVGVEDGQLAVYSGLPWSVGPLELNSVYLRSSRSYVLLDARQQALVDARRVHTQGGALRLAEDLGMLP